MDDIQVPVQPMRIQSHNARRRLSIHLLPQLQKQRPASAGLTLNRLYNLHNLSENMEDKMTAINIKESTKEKFDTLGSVGMNQDDVQNMLIDFWLKHKKSMEK